MLIVKRKEKIDRNKKRENNNYVPKWYIKRAFPGGFSEPLELNTSLILSLITAAVSAILEIFSPGKWDDVIVPIGTAIIAFLIYLVL